MRSFAQHPRFRVAALTVFSYGAVTRGLAYIDPPDTGLTTFVDALVPLHIWAAVWITAGIAMLAGIWHRDIARWALSLGATMWLVWAASYMWATLVGDSSRGWVTGSAMIVIAGAMYITAALAASVGPPPGPVIPDREDTG